MFRSVLSGAAALAALAAPPAAQCTSGTVTPAILNSVACTSQADCVAVGTANPSQPPPKQSAAAYTETGGKWAAVRVQVPSDTSSGPSTLKDVSCVSATDCLAFGTYTHSSITTLAEHWNGSEWTVSGGGSSYSTVSCSTSGCLAVGGGNTLAAGYWNGSVWTQVTLPGIPSGRYSWTVTPACSQDGHCLIVAGGINGPVTGPGAEVLAWTWYRGKVVKVMAPPWIPYAPGPAISDAVLSCPATGWCLLSTVNDDPGTGNYTPVSWLWNGSKWTPVTPAPSQDVPGWLSCASPGSCVAINRSAQPEYWNGRDWAQMKLPAPPEGGSYSLIAVDCLAVKDCTAVGVNDSSDPVYGRWNGETWTIGTMG